MRELDTRIIWRIGLALLSVHAVVATINLSPLIDSYTVSTVLDMNGEGNAVVWLSSASLLVAGGIAAWLALQADVGSRLARGWWVVAAAFALLSLDETASLHEFAGEKASALFEVSWLPSLYMWVIVVAPFAAAFAIWMLRWFGAAFGWRTLAGRLAIVAISLWMFVPFFEALDPSLGGPRFLVTAEETFESVGETLVIVALLLHARTVVRTPEHSLVG